MVENIAGLRKWQFIKEWRTQYEEFVRVRENNRQKMVRWVKQATSLQVLNYVAELFKQRREEVILHRKKDRTAYRFQVDVWKPRKLMLGKTLKDRTFRRVKQALTFGMNPAKM
jgi:hypothetical protein